MAKRGGKKEGKKRKGRMPLFLPLPARIKKGKKKNDITQRRGKKKRGPSLFLRPGEKINLQEFVESRPSKKKRKKKRKKREDPGPPRRPAERPRILRRKRERGGEPAISGVSRPRFWPRKKKEKDHNDIRPRSVENRVGEPRLSRKKKEKTVFLIPSWL